MAARYKGLDQELDKCANWSVPVIQEKKIAKRDLFVLQWVEHANSRTNHWSRRWDYHVYYGSQRKRIGIWIYWVGLNDQEGRDINGVCRITGAKIQNGHLHTGQLEEPIAANVEGLLQAHCRVPVINLCLHLKAEESALETLRNWISVFQDSDKG